eukprot:UN08554
MYIHESDMDMSTATQRTNKTEIILISLPSAKEKKCIKKCQ